jgi:excisionase family DNA binding protein
MHEEESRPRRLLTVAETADELRLSERTIRQLIAVSRLASVRIGRRVLVPAAEIHRIAGNTRA